MKLKETKEKQKPKKKYQEKLKLDMSFGEALEKIVKFIPKKEEKQKV